MSAGNRKRAFVGVAVVGFRAGGGRLPQAPTSAPTGAASTSAAAAAAAARRAVRCMRVTARRRPVVSAARRRYVSGAIELANAYLVHLTDGHWGVGVGGGCGGGGGGVGAVSGLAGGFGMSDGPERSPLVDEGEHVVGTVVFGG